MTWYQSSALVSCCKIKGTSYFPVPSHSTAPSPTTTKALRIAISPALSSLYQWNSSKMYETGPDASLLIRQSTLNFLLWTRQLAVKSRKPRWCGVAESEVGKVGWERNAGGKKKNKKQVIQGMSSGEGEGTASDGNKSNCKEFWTIEGSEMRERLIERAGGERGEPSHYLFCLFLSPALQASVREGIGCKALGRMVPCKARKHKSRNK